MTDCSSTVALARDLIQRRSLTPVDAGCQDILIDRLVALGFTVNRLRFGDADNFWAVRGEGAPLLCLAGHTDVVPTGPEENWLHPPFSGFINDGNLYGRGAVDMKGGVAALVTAVEQFLSEHSDHRGQIAFLITSDEEGPALNGTTKVVEWLRGKGIIPDWCLIAEPSSSESVGDVIRNGRRGTLSCTMRVAGIQGHVAYPHLAVNPIHMATPALAELTKTVWDDGNEYFPATSFQISNVSAGAGVSNVIPGELNAMFNFRFSTEITVDQIKIRTCEILGRHGLEYSLEWRLGGQPFLTTDGELVYAVASSIKAVTGIETELSTAGGTSDGRFIATLGSQVIELGLLNNSAHKVDEQTTIEDLDTLRKIYTKILKQLLV